MARSTAFLLGFGFALLPAVGPFLAVLLFISARLRARMADLSWVAAALLLSLGPAVAGDLRVAVGSVLQVAAGFLIYRAFSELAPTDAAMIEAKPVGAGLLSGFAMVIVFHLLQVDAWNFDTAKTIAQAIVWRSSPALFGHTVLVLGGLIAVISPSRYVRWGALGLAAIGILMSGSREAAIAWLAISVLVVVAANTKSRWQRLGEASMIAVMAAVALGLGPHLGWGNVGFLLQPAGAGTGPNLLQGTEIPFGDWWDKSWVSVTSGDVRLGDASLTAYGIRKNGAEGWLRMQQAIEIAPNTLYTVSAWMRDRGTDSRPGIQGWGQSREGDEVQPFMVSGSLSNNQWNTDIIGPGSLPDAGIADTHGDWHRAYVSFVYEGSGPLAWYVGLVPDSRSVAGTEAEFAGFQLEKGPLSEYQPGFAARGLELGVARLPLWHSAWEAARARPLLGWGNTSFPDYFLENWPERSRLHVVPAHAHNLFLQTVFERGLVGLFGMLLLIGALAASAWNRGDLPFLAVLGAILFANTFDNTLMYGGVFYPLVAVAGWRAGQAAVYRRTNSRLAKQMVARTGLALADCAAVAAAYALAGPVASAIGVNLNVSGIMAGSTSGTLYLLLLWPLLSWRDGLYPGYGLTPQQELKKQVTVGVQAGLLIAAILVFFGDFVSVAVPVAALTVLLSFGTAPLARALMKRGLHSVRLWGRDVVILGAGDTGHRVVRSLQRTPLDGLHPIAFFDDDGDLANTHIRGVPVRGSLKAAGRFASRHGVMHAVIAIPSLHAHELRALLDTKGRQFRIVQYVPNLAGIPVEDVFASSMDGMLTLEVRNNLASRRNRVVKRAIDIVIAALGLIAIAPLLIAIGLWVRVDSAGASLHRSERIGQNGRRFHCLKFRTMPVDAEERLRELIASHSAIREEYQRFHKIENDPRVTRAGRFLRKFSLDELPQLLNVLAGQMSLVGPRPYLVRELELMDGHADVILQAKPGMTGYWQVSERNDVTFQDRLEMEAHYVRNWSIWWDIVILVRTLPAMLEKRGK